MPVIAVNVVKVLFVVTLYGFLFYVARAMRGHVAGPPAEPAPTPSTSTRRSSRPAESAPPAPRRAVLHVQAPGGASPRTVEMKGRLVIGRGSSADVTVDDEYASDLHAAFEFDGETVWVEDLGSTNGTRIGDAKLDGRTAVLRGTEVLVGRTRVVVR